MKWYFSEIGELRSSRFERLCEILCEDGGTANADRHKIFGHLMAWRLRWGGDPQYDFGIFWDVSAARMGVWSDWPDPKAFASALKAAGYVKPVDEVFPPELCNGRKGFVAMRAEGGTELDNSWGGWHRHCARKYDLYLYLTDRGQRVGFWLGQKARPPLDLARLPPGWMDGVEEHLQEQTTETMDGEARYVPPSQPGATGAARFSSAAAVAGHQGPGSPSPAPQGGMGRPPHHVATTWPARASASGPPSLRQDVDVQTNQPNQRQRRIRTGNEPTPQMRDFIRQHKYDQTMACLRMIEDTDETALTWRFVCEHHLEECQQLLAEMTERDESWSVIENPSSILFRRFFSRYIQWKRRRRGRDDDGEDYERGGRRPKRGPVGFGPTAEAAADVRAQILASLG